ncbi:MAG: putative LPS assembly protein LptD [Bacteroidales bacterium]|nr:putative LPS assembly protein LptD [Bacteroidales bacterium]
MRKKILLSLFVLVCSLVSGGAEARDIWSYKFGKQDTTIKTTPDSSKLVQIDTSNIKRADSLNIISADSVKKKGSLLYPAFSGAKDSIVEDFSGGERMIYYYGDVNVKYGNLELKSAYMAYNMKTNTVFASGIKDTAGVLQGKPEMTEGTEKYTMETVYYNFDSKKALISNMITQEAEGFLHGDRLKKMPDNSINISGGKYTTCDHEHPHFYLQLTNAKVVTQPNRSTVFGPAYMVLEDVPTPFALPFGFVPNQMTRASGILIPTFNDEASRGFSLKGLGYYFVLGDHFDVTLTGDIYTLGSWNAMLTSRYRKRYKYNGDLSINYSVNQVGEQGAPDFYQSKDFSVRWSHSQDAKARPGTSFRASVNFATPMNDRFNSYDIQQSLQNQISSSISYGKTFQGTPFSLSANILHSQNSLDSSYAFTVPNFTFTMNRIFPFKRKDAAGKEKFYEKISFNYSSNLNNKVNFKASDFGGDDFLSKFRSGMQHNFQIGLPTFNLFNYIQFSPGVSYGMNWFFQKNEKYYDSETGKVESEIGDIFSHFGATTDFAASLSMATTIYGLFNFGPRAKLRTIRHMVKPAVSFSFRPEQGTPSNGYRTLRYIDNSGVEQEREYNIYESLLYGYPSKGSSASMSFSLGNNFEAKVVSKTDTTDGGLKKIKLIDNLNFASSYNFLADSMKLANISASMSTTIFGSLAFNANANLDPYAVDNDGKRYNKLNFLEHGLGHLARLTNASASFSYQFSGKGSRRGAGKGLPDGKPKDGSQYVRVYNHPVTGEYIPGGWVYYLDPDNPWSVNVNYNYSYSKSYSNVGGVLNTKHNHTQTLGLSAQASLGKDLSINVYTGIDLMKMALTTTQLSATYDLHCFTMSVSWVPSGMWESWSFRINAKASALADLLQYKKNASYWDRGQGF